MNKNWIIGVACFATLATTVGFANENGEEDSGFYVFLGAEVRAEHRSKYLPIVSADGKGLYLDNLKGVKRVGWGVSCSAQRQVSLSNSYAEIDELRYDFGYRKAAVMETQALSDMSAMESMTEQAVGEINQKIESGEIPTERVEEAYQEIADLELNQESFEDQIKHAIENDEFDTGELDDTIYLKMTVTPSTNLTDAYCAVLVSYQKGDAESRFKGRRTTTVRVRKLGDLLEGVPQKVAFSLALSEGVYAESSVELFLYSGEGKPVATSLSRGLKELTNKQLERLIELEQRS